MANKVITLADLREHTTKDSLWVLLHGNGQSPRICISSRRLTVFRSMVLTQLLAPWRR